MVEELVYHSLKLLLLDKKHDLEEQLKKENSNEKQISGEIYEIDVLLKWLEEECARAVQLMCKGGSKC